MWAKLLKPFVSFLLIRTRLAGSRLRTIVRYERELLNHRTQQQDYHTNNNSPAHRDPFPNRPEKLNFGRERFCLRKKLSQFAS